MFDKDPQVKEILKNATPQDIKNGVIEKTLRRLHPDIRSKLDEVKRNIIMEYRQKLRKAKMDDKVPDDLYKFQDEDLKHLLKEVNLYNINSKQALLVVSMGNLVLFWVFVKEYLQTSSTCEHYLAL